ncbi:hypothetical protein CRV24_010457 [Beauveria bassiana]|nr:hypothetical protein CRV24_010457 [Beauveria bassiana]KAH8713591.1 hypothetical protein HC256_006719 [Beauveria bassiana]
MPSLLAQPKREFCCTIRNSWPETEKDQVAEIEQFGTPIDYIKLCADAEVVFLGQTVSNEPVRNHLWQNAAALKEAGVTHFAIEFNQMPWTSDYKRLCHKLSASGIKIILADVDQRRTRDSEQREAHMTKCITDILEAEPGAKVAALFSSFHAGRYIMDGLRPAAVRIESAKYSLIRLRYFGGAEYTPTLITQPAWNAGLGSFALDMRPYGADAPFGGDADFGLYLG